MSMTKKLLALLCAVALVGATACGSGDDTEDTATQDVDAEQEATRADDEDTDATDDDDADEVDDDDADDDADDQAGSNGEFTGDLGECMELSGALMSLMFLPMVGMFGIEDEEIREMEEEMAQFGGSVPSELEDDIEVINDAFDSFLSEAGSFDFDDEMDIFDPEVTERMEAAAEELESPEVEAAFENLEAFLEENCDFEDMNPFEMDPEDLNAEGF